MTNINAYKQNYIGSDMKSKAREPEALYRDNYDPIGYEREEENINTLNLSNVEAYQSQYAQSKFAQKFELTKNSTIPENNL